MDILFSPGGQQKEDNSWGEASLKVLKFLYLFFKKAFHVFP